MKKVERRTSVDAGEAKCANATSFHADSASTGIPVAPRSRITRMSKASTRNIFGRFAWLTLARLGAAALQALILIVVARSAGPTSFGLLSAFLGITVIFQAFLDFGFSTYITRLRAYDPEAPQVTWSFHIYRFLGLILFLCLGLGAILMGIAAGQSWWYLLPIALAAAIERQADIRVAIALADGDVWKNFVLIISRRLLTVFFLGGAIYLEWDAVLGFGLSSAIAVSISLAMSFALIKFNKARIRMTRSDAMQIFKDARGFWANSVGSQLRNFDILVVAVVASPAMAGYYSAIAKTTNPLLMLSSSLSAVLLPIISGLGNISMKVVVRPVILVMAPMAVVYLALAVYAEKIILLVFGSSYSNAIDGFRIVMLALIFAGTSSIINSVLQGRGHQQVVGHISIASALTGLILVLAGILWFGVTGAATGLAVSHVLQCLLLLCVSYHLWEKRKRN